jgi:hypothetical protein
MFVSVDIRDEVGPLEGGDSGSRTPPADKHVGRDRRDAHFDEIWLLWGRYRSNLVADVHAR